MKIYISWHSGYRVLVLEFPFDLELILSRLERNIRMCLSYHKAITLESPYWNGYEWIEWDNCDDIPF